MQRNWTTTDGLWQEAARPLGLGTEVRAQAPGGLPLPTPPRSPKPVYARVAAMWLARALAGRLCGAGEPHQGGSLLGLAPFLRHRGKNV